MKLLPDADDFAEGLSASFEKGGWLVAPLGGMAMLYLLQDRLVLNPVNTPPSVIAQVAASIACSHPNHARWSTSAGLVDAPASRDAEFMSRDRLLRGAQ